MVVISKVNADSSPIRESENLSRELVGLPGTFVIKLFGEVQCQVCPGIGAPEGWNVLRGPETGTDSQYFLDSSSQGYLDLSSHSFANPLETRIKGLLPLTLHWLIQLARKDWPLLAG